MHHLPADFYNFSAGAEGNEGESAFTRTAILKGNKYQLSVLLFAKPPPKDVFLPHG